MAEGRINWLQKAGEAWPILVQAAMDPARPLLYYEDLGRSVGVHRRNVRLVLDPIQSFCIGRQIPPLTALVIQKVGHKPGTGFIAHDVNDIESAYKDVRAFDWKQITNPFSELTAEDTEQKLTDLVLKNKHSATEVYAKVKVRGIAQRIFRSALIKIYHGRCAVCGLSFLECLEAAHIKSWASSSHTERLDIQNGLLLCSLHHRLFDSHQFTIDADFRLAFAKRKRMKMAGKVDAALSSELHGEPITLPLSSHHWPASDYISRHHARCVWLASDTTKHAAD